MATVKTAMSKVGRIATLAALSIASGSTLVACNFSVSTAALDNVKLCREILKGEQCTSDTTQFAKNTSQLFATADLKYAPEGTKVKVDWKYLGGEAGQATPIDSVSLETKDNMSVITSSLPTPKNGWPTGEYEVVFSLGTDNSTPIHKKFSVVSSQ